MSFKNTEVRIYLHGKAHEDDVSVLQHFINFTEPHDRFFFSYFVLYIFNIQESRVVVDELEPSLRYPNFDRLTSYNDRNDSK